MQKFFFKKIILLLSIITIAGNCFSLPFNSKITNEEKKKLKSGEVIVRNIGYSKNICLENCNEYARRAIEELQDLRPTYLAEVIKVVPFVGNEKLDVQVAKVMLDIPNYADIPYYSEYNKGYGELYSSASLRFLETFGNYTNALVDIDMIPFGTVNMEVQLEQNSHGIYYYSTNMSKMKFAKIITCVGAYKSKSIVIVFRDGDNWILYGAEGIRAFHIPFMDKRIQIAFVNRVKAFCNYIFTQTELSHL
jgi:hypothetical protein